MRLLRCLLLFVVSALGEDTETRIWKRLYVADAVGNTLPPPASLPATVGSPVNLITPDKYEFYTFDESGDLVKRLMTLEEIQAIVAAGEDSEGIVTFANNNQPTISFNFSQPPYNKVHSVVTNVQNVLKAQMEAHKNQPQIPPTLDTPDVSDSWSLILPSIFGNTGVDVVPDKTIDTFSTPETETIDFDSEDLDETIENLSKEGNNNLNSSTTVNINNAITEELKHSDITVLPTSHEPKPNTLSSPLTENPTQSQYTISKTANNSLKYTLINTTSKPKPPLLSTNASTSHKTANITRTTQRPTTTIVSTEIETKSSPKLRVTSTTTQIPRAKNSTLTTTTKPLIITTHQVKLSSTVSRVPVTTKPTSFTNNVLKNVSSGSYEKVSTFVPISTVIEKTTQKPNQEVNSNKQLVTSNYPVVISSSLKPSTTYTISPTTIKFQLINNTNVEEMGKLEKLNLSHLTTESSIVTHPTVIESEKRVPESNKQNPQNDSVENSFVVTNSNKTNENQSVISFFDVAQSISQIASDLGDSSVYQPIKTTNNLRDTTKLNGMDLESKENIEIDIPVENKNANNDKFVKITTLESPVQQPNATSKKEVEEKVNQKVINNIENITENNLITNITTVMPSITTFDPVLSESMDDLLLQVVNPKPETVSNKTSNTQNSSLSKTNPTTVSSNETVILRDVKNVTGLTQNKIDIMSTQGSLHKNKTIDPFGVINDTKTLLATEVNHITTENMSLDLKQNQTSWNNFKQTPTAQNSATYDSSLNKPNSSHAQVTDLQNKLQTLTTQLPASNMKSNKNKTLPVIIKTIEKPKADEFKKKVQKVNIDDKELHNERNNTWKLISTVSPTKNTDTFKEKVKLENHDISEYENTKIIDLNFSKENQGLEVTNKNLGNDIVQFTDLCNELAFQYWNALMDKIDRKRSFVLSPYSITSMLAMMFMGARGATSGEMNEILKLDDMVTFNPHFTLKNISDSIQISPEAGVVVSAFIRELYSDVNKGKILRFYKERAQHFYNGHVEEINFKLISDIIRRRTNLLVKRYTWGRIVEYMKSNTITMQPPLAAFSTNIFQTDCTGSSVEGRDGEMYFVVSPNVRQRRLVPVPAVIYRKDFLAGYDPILDATAAALGTTNSMVSTLFLMPGQQGNVVQADDLEALEKRLLNSNLRTPTWNRILRTLLPRIGLELQIPRFSHKSVFNVSSTLKMMGLKDLFNADHADLGGLNGPSKDLYLSDMVQSTTFVTCGEGIIADQHHVEEYPDSAHLNGRGRTSRWAHGWDEPRDYQRAFHDPHDVGDAMNLPLHLRPRQARLPASSQLARLKFDRPFLFFVRHNPSGIILYVGRYNPRLLP